MWEFSVGLYMITLWPDSLLIAAAYGVTESVSIALFGPLIGHLVDKLSYIQILRLWLLSQNVSFMVAGAAIIAILLKPAANYVAFKSLLILINVAGAFGMLSTLAGTILIEREWVVVISEDQEPGVLTKMNSIIRRIDLTCNLLAPVVTGFIISFVSLVASAMAFALWNLISLLLQYWLLMNVYNGFPSLRDASHRKSSKPSSIEVEGGESRKLLVSQVSNDVSNVPETSARRRSIDRFLNLPYISSWRLYFAQDVKFPGLALALLYFSVLSFGTLMTATLEWQGIPAYVIGVARGITAAVGISATFLYPVMESRFSTVGTGLLSIWLQWSFLLLCIVSIFVKSKVVSAYMLMGGVASSRLGLWMFDLAVIQQMQDQVSESDRCVVGGVQNSLQSILDLMTYIMGMVISNPQDFWKLTILSFLLVTMAAALYTIYHVMVARLMRIANSNFMHSIL